MILPPPPAAATMRAYWRERLGRALHARAWADASHAADRVLDTIYPGRWK